MASPAIIGLILAVASVVLAYRIGQQQGFIAGERHGFQEGQREGTQRGIAVGFDHARRQADESEGDEGDTRTVGRHGFFAAAAILVVVAVLMLTASGREPMGSDAMPLSVRDGIPFETEHSLQTEHNPATLPRAGWIGEPKGRAAVTIGDHSQTGNGFVPPGGPASGEQSVGAGDSVTRTNARYENEWLTLDGEWPTTRTDWDATGGTSQ